MTVAPLYMPVYPVGAQEDALNCQHGPDNCPDHGPLIAGLAAHVMPGTYGGGVAGHDHLLAATGANFNGACEPVVVLFTSAEAAANEHLTTESAVNDAVDNHVAIEIPLKAATFSCTRVSAAVYQQGLPVPPVP
jgi:hypothetical protein